MFLYTRLLILLFLHQVNNWSFVHCFNTSQKSMYSLHTCLTWKCQLWVIIHLWHVILCGNSAFWKWSFSIFHSCSYKFKTERKKSGETMRNLAIISCKYYTFRNLWKIRFFCKKSVNAYLFVWSLPHSLAWRFKCSTIQNESSTYPGTKN